jgi:Signal transduction histidine kinase
MDYNTHGGQTVLLAVTLLIIIYSVVYVAAKRDSGAFFRLLFSLSFALFMFGLLIYIAKKGGVANSFTPVLYLTSGIRRQMQYTSLTLGRLGYIVALGRYLFPLLFLILSVHAANSVPGDRLKTIYLLISIVPVITLVLYVPPVFERLFVHSESLLRLMVVFSRTWILVYIAAGWILQAMEYHAITVSFFRRRFLMNALFYVSLTIIYLMYCPQDPAQIYLFYRNDYMWMLGLWYLGRGFSVPLYLVVTALTVLGCFTSALSLIQGVHETWNERHDEVVLQKKGKAARPGINIFTHGLKNQLLANRVLISHLETGTKGSSAETEVAALKANNELMLKRIEDLYRFGRQDAVRLSKTKLDDIVALAVEKAKAKHPEIELRLRSDERNHVVLADEKSLSEAISNIISNGWEASGKEIELKLRQERLWVSLEVADKGPGIPKNIRKHIYDPFFSTKNSLSSWGMGMYFTHQVIKSHRGSIRFETSPAGTAFLLLIPSFDRRARE